MSCASSRDPTAARSSPLRARAETTPGRAAAGAAGPLPPEGAAACSGATSGELVFDRCPNKPTSTAPATTTTATSQTTILRDIYAPRSGATVDVGRVRIVDIL